MKTIKRMAITIMLLCSLIISFETNAYAYSANSAELEKEMYFESQLDNKEFEELKDGFNDDIDDEFNDEKYNFDLEKEVEFEVGVGEILDKYTDKNIEYKNKTVSMDYVERENVIAEILNIYDLTSDNEKLQLDIYVDGALETLKEEHHDARVMELEKTFDSKMKNNFYKNDMISLYASTKDSFDYGKAIDYAYDYYKNYNTAYPNLSKMGGDCANFVSQILKSGGYKTDNEWYIKRKNYKYNKPINSSQLNESWDLANPSPWISAKYFNKYWSDIVSTDTKSATDFTENDMFNELKYYKGDTVQILKKSMFSYYGYHTMFITNYTKK